MSNKTEIEKINVAELNYRQPKIEGLFEELNPIEDIIVYL